MTLNPIFAYWIECPNAPFSAVVFSDTEESARKAGECGFEAVWGTRDVVTVERYPKYDSKYVTGMKLNECFDPMVIDETWDKDE